MEAFILRLFREENKVGFVKAFSDEPSLFINGFGKLERCMKSLLLKSVYAWPRFHIHVMENIAASGTVDLIELRISLSKAMKDIQAGLVDCMNQCLLEIKRCNIGVFSINVD